jgi:DNA-binding transcriptional ArsR family regulator
MNEVERLQAVFQTLADVNRLRIIRFVGEGRRAVSEIVAALKISQPLASHHLKVLRSNGLLAAEREGPFVYYRLNDKRLLDALGLFADIFKEFQRKRAGKPMFCRPPWRGRWPRCE